MRYRFEECLARGEIVAIAPDPALVEKEVREAAADLVSAERSLENGDDKWATVQAYYAIFHALRAPVLRLGYREKSHTCLRFAVEAIHQRCRRLCHFATIRKDYYLSGQ